MLISSSAASALMGRWLFGTSKQLKMTAQTIGADAVGTLFTGFASKDKHQRLPFSIAVKAQTIANKLIAT